MRNVSEFVQQIMAAGRAENVRNVVIVQEIGAPRRLANTTRQAGRNRQRLRFQSSQLQ